MKSTTAAAHAPRAPKKDRGGDLIEFESLGIFFRELLANPGSMGAACPSSKRLANCLATFVPRNLKGHVIELGAGTGVVTAAILNKGVAPKQVIAVERSKELAAVLRKRFPEIHVLCGDAANLTALLADQFGIGPGAVDCVVSSLPLRSLPESVVHDISASIEEMLSDKGRFVQFTYDLRPQRLMSLQRFKQSRSRMIWINFPPARVDVFKRVAKTV